VFHYVQILYLPFSSLSYQPDIMSMEILKRVRYLNGLYASSHKVINSSSVINEPVNFWTHTCSN